MRDLLRPSADLDAQTAVAAMHTAPDLVVGDERVIRLLTSFSSSLLRPSVTRRYPELASLGFFLRRSELVQLSTTAQRPAQSGLRVPRGIVFHVPPANVDTVFVYSWALSLLCGNANIVRISERSAGAARVILDVIAELLPEHPDVEVSQLFVSFPHEDPAFERLSSSCDTRVIWGGDTAVRAVRGHQLSPHATEVAFPDRYSMAALNINALNTMDDRQLDDAAHAFMNDSWWFDQAACSSPRTIVWVGSSADLAPARRRFLASLEQQLEVGKIGADPAMAMERRVSAYGLALRGSVDAIDTSRPRLSLSHSTFVTPREWYGAGGFIEVHLERLIDLVGAVTTKDQTLSHLGFSEAELIELATLLNRRSFDRIVPLGAALRFERIWDGHDLISEFTRTVTISMR